MIFADFFIHTTTMSHRKNVLIIFNSFLFIIILYYIQKRIMHKNQKESYRNVSACGILQHEKMSKMYSPVRPISSMLYKDQITLAPNDPNRISLNQNLAGPANPKTLIAPVVVPRLADLDYWKTNNLINHSHLNTPSQYDTYLSGYKVSNRCDRIDPCLYSTKPLKGNGVTQKTIEEEYTNLNGTMYEGISDQCRPVNKSPRPPKAHIVSPYPSTGNPYHIGINHQVESKENYTEKQNPLTKHSNYSIKAPIPSTNIPYYMEGFESVIEPVYVKPNKSGWVNSACGYNPEQVYTADLPSNLNVGNCEKSPAMKQFNKNLFTQTIQPDIFTVGQIIEPINSNIGISFTQQFPPTTYSSDSNGLTFVEHDPRLYQQPEDEKEPYMNVTEADIYDPRFTGYGTSYRSYNEPVTGQTRFYYDDINAVRMPNYISRSNIDFANYADSYGSLNNSNKNGNPVTSNIHALAQKTFLDSSLRQRTSLQQSLMRKRNSELWQTRKMPHAAY